MRPFGLPGSSQNKRILLPSAALSAWTGLRSAGGACLVLAIAQALVPSRRLFIAEIKN